MARNLSVQKDQSIFGSQNLDQSIPSSREHILCDSQQDTVDDVDIYSKMKKKPIIINLNPNSIKVSNAKRSP